MFRLFCLDVVFVSVFIGKCWCRCSFFLFARLCLNLSCLRWWDFAWLCFNRVVLLCFIRAAVGGLLVLLFFGAFACSVVLC